MNILFFDTETTGLPRKDPETGETHQPNITQLGFILERGGIDMLTVDALIKPDNWYIHTGIDPKTGIEESGTGISRKSTEITGITMEMCEKDGIPIADAVEMFVIAAENADVIVCHNTAFDMKVMAAEYARLQPRAKDPNIVYGGRPSLCTMKASTPICKIRKGDGKTSFKWPRLEELMMFLFNEELENAHSAIVDIKATRRCFHKLIDLGAFDKDVYRMARAGLIREDFLDQVREAA